MIRTNDHLTIHPKIIYFGTPVVLLSTENEDGTSNLAPMSSAWALGQVVVLGLGSEGQTARNLRERPDLVINLPSAEQWQAVKRLAPLTGRDPVPDHKRSAFQYEPAKFAAAGLRPEPAELVRPQRVASARSNWRRGPYGSTRPARRLPDRRGVRASRTRRSHHRRARHGPRRPHRVAPADLQLPALLQPRH